MHALNPWVKQTEESKRFKIWLMIGILFLMSAWASCREVKYLMWGRSADAIVYRVKKSPVKHRKDEPPMVDVHYRWTDEDDGEREDLIREEPAWSPAVGDVLEIDYLPGAKDSRTAGTRNYIAIGFFVVMGGIAVTWFVLTWREGSQKPRRRR